MNSDSLNLKCTLFAVILLTTAFTTDSFAYQSQGKQGKISGYFSSEAVWTGKYPVIFTESFMNSRNRYGRILEITDEGISFKQNNSLLSGGQGTQFYTFGELDGVIDSSGHLIHGKVPDRLKRIPKIILEIENRSTGTNQPVLLKPNQLFNVPLEAGDYRVKQVYLQRHRAPKIPIESADRIAFSVTADRNTFIGHLKLRSDPADMFTLRQTISENLKPVIVTEKEIRTYYKDTFLVSAGKVAGLSAGGAIFGALLGLPFATSSGDKFDLVFPAAVTAGMYLFPVLAFDAVSGNNRNEAKSKLLMGIGDRPVIDSTEQQLYSISAGMTHTQARKSPSNKSTHFTVSLNKKWISSGPFLFLGGISLIQREYQTDTLAVEYELGNYGTSTFSNSVLNIDYSFQPGFKYQLSKNLSMEFFAGLSHSVAVSTHTKSNTISRDYSDPNFEPPPDGPDARSHSDPGKHGHLLSYIFSGRINYNRSLFEFRFLQTRNEDEIIDEIVFHDRVKTLTFLIGYTF